MTTTVTTEVKVLRRSEVARELGIHPNTVMSWTERGFLHGVKFPNGETRYRPEEVDALKKKIFEQDE
jgi:predicted site-specific integrase-resolvase